MNVFKSIQDMNSMSMDFKGIEQEIINQYCCLGCKKWVVKSKTKTNRGPNAGKWIIGAIGCDCKEIAVIKRKQQIAKVKNLYKLFDQQSLMNSSLQNASFENYESMSFQEQKQKAVTYAESFSTSQPSTLFFQGTFGTGKSHLSASVAKEVMQKGHSAVFISVPKLLTRIKDTYNKNSETSEMELLRSLREVDLVVFDDVGAEKDSTGWVKQKLFEIMDDRAGKNNIFTTNLESSDFQTKDDQRLFSRMMDNATPIIMNGPDYRRRHLRKEG